MSYRLARTEDDAEVKKAVDEAQAVYDKHGKREWVEWVGKTLMPRLHAQIEMERVDAMRAEQDAIEEERFQAEQVQREEEQATKEAELEKMEEEYIQQLDAKLIDEEKFRELVNELDLERAMAESVTEGPATMQDEEVGESEREESAEEELVAAEKGVELSTVSKEKRKVALAQVKVYAAVDEPVSDLPKSTSICANIFAYSATGVSCEERSRNASRTRTSDTARSVRRIRVDALGGGRAAKSSRGRSQSHTRGPGRAGDAGRQVIERGRSAGSGGA
jgi:hypothetical protein